MTELRRVVSKPEQDFQVDRENGVIRGVSAIQAVEALGHGMMVDETTLQQVVDHGNAAEGGIKSRYTHPGLSADGLGRHLGRAKDFRLSEDGNKALFDFYLADSAAKSPEGDLRDYTLSLAEHDPDSAGFSIVAHMSQVWKLDDGGEAASYERPENAIGDLPFARLPEKQLRSGEIMNPLRAVDLVAEPATNRDGMFSAGTTNPLCAEAYAQLDAVGEAALDANQGQITAFCELHGIEASKSKDFIRQWQAWRKLTSRSMSDNTPDTPTTLSEKKDDDSPKSTIGQKFAAAISDKAKLLADNKLLKEENERLKEDAGQVESLTAKIEEQATEIAELKDNATTVEKRAAEIHAELGVPQDELIDAEADAGDAQLSAAELREKLNTEKDPKKKAELIKQLKEARGFSVVDQD